MTSATILRELLDYDPDTGDFNWKRTPLNQVLAGAKAGWIENSGYRRISIGGKPYLAHRLAWLYMTGDWPECQIDHLNRTKSDNRWANLRPATNSQNQANTGPKSLNTSGIKGVYWHKRIGRWYAAIQVGGQLRQLGYCDTKNEAAALYAVAAGKYFGEYASVS